MDIKQVKDIFFIGIGGIGMSALARYFIKTGYRVSGYDICESEITRALEVEGAKIRYTDEVRFLKPLTNKHTLVVYTPAVPKTSHVYNYLSSNGFTIKKRSEVLAYIANKNCIAIAGTHGKTTVSVLLAFIMAYSQMKFTAFLGGISENFNSNFYSTGQAYFVVEADEYDKSFLHLDPVLLCVTSTDLDHLDIYKTEKEFKETFKIFSSKIEDKSKKVVHDSTNLDGIRFGLNAKNNDFYVENVRNKDHRVLFDIVSKDASYKDMSINMPGNHNILNAMAAFVLANLLGIRPSLIKEAISKFEGIKRRFTYHINLPDLVYIDDYAHHPTEIDAVSQGIKQIYPNTPATVIFQPHLYSRTQSFLQGFAKSLAKFHTVALLDIYPARELPIDNITSYSIYDMLEIKNKFMVKKNEIINFISKQKPRLLITLGAGDIGSETFNIKNKFKNGYI